MSCRKKIFWTQPWPRSNSYIALFSVANHAAWDTTKLIWDSNHGAVWETLMEWLIQMLAEPVDRSIHPVLSLCCRSQRSAARTAPLIVPSRTSLASIWCLDGIQIHHDVLELVSSCSGCREARKSGKPSREPAEALASQRGGKTLKDGI